MEHARIEGTWSSAGQRRDFWRQARKVLRRPQFRFGLVALLIIFGWYSIFYFIPIFRGLTMAFQRYNFLEASGRTYVGLTNFKTVGAHFLFPIALKNTLLYALQLWGYTFPLALLTSVCLVSIPKFQRFYQFTIFMPVVVSMVAMALLFKQALAPDTGVANAILRALNLPQGKWLTGQNSAMPTVAVIDSWKILGSYMVLLTAGLLNIPGDIYEAAKVDGANSWQTFWKITIPCLAHVLVLVITQLLIAGLQMFISGTLLPPTSGGPGYATTVLTIWLYSEAFTNWRFGFASAIAMVLFLIVLIVALLQMRLRPDWEY